MYTSTIKTNHINRKKFVIIVLITACVLIVVELIALGWLLQSVGRYKQYWEKRSQESGEITYLALGDSAAQGIGASSPARGYVGLIAKRLQQETGKSVRVVNLSVTGAKLSDYLRDQAPKIKDIKADFVTIEIGANDIRTYNEESFKSEFIQVLATLPDGTFIANMPLFNSRPGSTNKAKNASIVIEELVQNDKRLKFVDLQKQTSENQSIFGFAPDLFHPNNISYKHWADAFWLQIEKEL